MSPYERMLQNDLALLSIMVCSISELSVYSIFLTLLTNAHRMDNKQKLEATVPLGSCDLLAITETWWDVTGV